MEFAAEVERLRCIREGMGDMYTNDEILAAVGVGREIAGPLSCDQMAAEANLLLVELLEDPMAF